MDNLEILSYYLGDGRECKIKYIDHSTLLGTQKITLV
jgi:hypothetical protein